MFFSPFAPHGMRDNTGRNRIASLPSVLNLPLEGRSKVPNVNEALSGGGRDFDADTPSRNRLR